MIKVKEIIDRLVEQQAEIKDYENSHGINAHITEFDNNLKGQTLVLLLDTYKEFIEICYYSGVSDSETKKMESELEKAIAKTIVDFNILKAKRIIESNMESYPEKIQSLLSEISSLEKMVQ